MWSRLWYTFFVVGNATNKSPCWSVCPSIRYTLLFFAFLGTAPAQSYTAPAQGYTAEGYTAPAQGITAPAKPPAT